MRTPFSHNHLRIALAAGLAAGVLSAADQGSQRAAGQATMEAMEIQRQAVARMSASLEAQHRALETQLGPVPDSGFFTLPPVLPLPWPEGSLLPAAPAAVAPAAAPCPALPESELDALVEQAARREELEPDLLRGVIRQESAARPCAVSRKGAMGLMQLMPATALDLGVADAFDPKENVDAGAHFLKQLLRLYGGNVALALSAFNAGPGRVNQAGGVPPLPQTIDYVRKILGLLP
jgi:soluble lytic murein transglycosylase-like protein